jgi:hypothetical protein
MMRGEREIALTTPVSLTAFQPSLWDGSSLLRFQPRKTFGAGYDHRSLRDKIRRAPGLFSQAISWPKNRQNQRKLLIQKHHPSAYPALNSEEPFGHTSATVVASHFAKAAFTSTGFS